MKVLRKILLLLCVLSVIFSSVLPAAAAGTEGDPVLTDRDDFVWGLNMHNNYYAVYGTVNLEEQIHLAAEMGCKILRNNFNVNDLDYNDKFVKLCNAYGIQVMMVNYGSIKGSGSPAELQNDHDMFKMIAERYNGKNGCGKIDYIQLENELDLFFDAEGKKQGIIFGNGSSIDQYPKDVLERVCKNLKNASAAIREADSDVKIVINFSWEHYGMLTYFQDQGVDYDVIGHDWYTDMSSNYRGRGMSDYGIYDTLWEKFRKPIMICETNIWNNGPVDEDNPATWDSLVRLCKDYYSKEHVIGAIFYQMCDQLNFEGATYEREAHFGFIYADKYGNMIEPKAGYDRFQYICGGKKTPLITLESLEKKEDEPTDTPTKPTEQKKDPGKNQEPSLPKDNTPAGNYDNGKTISDVVIEDDPATDELPDNPAEEVTEPTDNKPLRVYHKGNSSNAFVWTIENTWTVIVGAVTAVIIAVYVILYVRMRKKIKTMSGS